MPIMILRGWKKIWKRFMKPEGLLRRRRRHRLGKRGRLRNRERNRGICIRRRDSSPVGLSPEILKLWMSKFNKNKNNTPKSTTKSNSPTPSHKWTTTTTTSQTTTPKAPTTTPIKKLIPTKKCKANSQMMTPMSSPNP